MEAVKQVQRLFIDGEWVETAKTHPIYNKYTGELYMQVCKAGKKRWIAQ